MGCLTWFISLCTGHIQAIIMILFNISQAGGQNSPYHMKQHIPFREEYLSEVFQQHPWAGNSDF